MMHSLQGSDYEVPLTSLCLFFSSRAQATGVPLVAEFCSASTVHNMIVQFVYIVGVTGVASLALIVGISVAKRVAGKCEHRGLRIFPTFVACTAAPIRRLLPLWWVLNSIMTMSAFGQVAATRLWPDFDRLMWGNGPLVLRVLRFASQLFQDLSQNVLIIAVTWIALNYKDRVVEWAEDSIERLWPSPSLLRLLGPVSTLSGWAIIAAAIFASMQNFGVNIQPLLASVGASSVILGLAAQSTLKNFTSAIMLYTAQPFTAGDRIQLLTTGGGKVIEGAG